MTGLPGLLNVFQRKSCFSMPDLNTLDAYDYELPEELIAQQPVSPRDHSRLMIYQRNQGALRHRQFRDLPEFLRPGDCLVLNQTRVVPARLYGLRDKTGGKWEGLFLRLLDGNHWDVIGQTRGKLLPGETVTIQQNGAATPLKLILHEKDSEGRWRAEPVLAGGAESSPWDLLESFGALPLPPYIQQGQAGEADRQRYQTVYARTPGAVAAPTAGLHFTPELLQRCQELGVQLAEVTLHVGLGTFRPVSVSQLDQHVMHAEWCEVNAETVEQLRQCQQNGGRIIAVGTTTVRTLETAAQSGELEPWQGESRLFIRPGYEFRVIDGLITNYHLPKSTLLILLTALMGYEPLQQAYQTAIQERYRFYSYGDAMLIL